ncbi:Autonomous glycyl radical cofactor [Erwinia pyrifoliae DSM 12163]|nr:autonomous glycyl radical cofactor [Erwinia pyrifoliae]CAY73430.1 Autonomous glycyl radical cofactor [Erwinia pyrifoliae DSM 12163]
MRCVCAKAGYREDPLIAVSDSGQIKCREIPLEVAYRLRVAGGQHLNANFLSREGLEEVVKHPEITPQLTLRVSTMWSVMLSVFMH